ncbi:MAG: PQQ-binding-like beta-propeller repeat protein [Candidatus Dadabacteria bacterium]|nr:PQQ-binding-like beta-propeller repeat protein [Candidatus Dadabacteria bacterium]
MFRADFERTANDETKGEIETSPSIDQGVVYFGSTEGYVYALE